MIHKAAQSALLFPELHPVNRANKKFSAFEMETEREVAGVFGRCPRSRPYADECPYYPFSFHRPRVRVLPHPYKVSFALRYNPFSVKNQE